MTFVRLRQKPQLHVRLRRKVAQLRELRGYALFSYPYVRAYMRTRARGVCNQLISSQFCSIQKTTSNRVTHVTTGISRVTAGVTIHFLRNQKERVG